MVTTLSQTPLTQVRYLAYLIQISFPCSHSKQLTKQSLLIMKMALDHHRHIPTMVKVLIIFRNAHQTGQHIRSASSCMQLIAFNKQYKILLESKINKLSRSNRISIYYYDTKRLKKRIFIGSNIFYSISLKLIAAARYGR